MAAIITDIGLTKLATASPLAPLEITHVAFGDNNGVWPKLLDPTATSLTNEVYRSDASDPIKTVAEPQILIFEGSIPGDVGGFTLREMAIFDIDGDMIAIGDIDRIVKPSPGSGNQIILTQRLHVKFSSTSDVDLIAQDVAIFDHQGLSNRSAVDAHPASSISTLALAAIGQGVSNVQTILELLKSAALRAVGTGGSDIPDTDQLNVRLATTGNLGDAAQRNVGNGDLDLVSNSELDSRLKTTGDLGTAALRNVGNGDLDLVANLELDSRLKTTGDLGTAALRNVGNGADQVPDKEILDVRFGEGSNVMVGAVVGFAMQTTPLGWIKANGAAISRTTYAQLFAKIGTFWGVGDGSTTFNVPDLRGEFIRMWDDGRGVDSGRVFGSFQDHEYEAHAHKLPEGGADYAVYGTRIDTNLQVEDFNASTTTTLRSLTSSEGGSETRPRNIALAAFIKY